MRKPKTRKFYKVDPDVRVGGAPSLQMENKHSLVQGRRFLGPPTGERGFPDYPEAPRFLFDTKLGRPPRDLEEYHAYWLMSDRMKVALEAIDPDGFAFVRCEVRLSDGAAGPTYWLCDVVRVLDAIDEAASRVKIEYRPLYNVKSYNLMGGANLIFKEDVVGSAHVFRMAHLEPAIICDQQMKDACKAAALKGIKFRDAANY